MNRFVPWTVVMVVVAVTTYVVALTLGVSTGDATVAAFAVATVAALAAVAAFAFAFAVAVAAVAATVAAVAFAFAVAVAAVAATVAAAFAVAEEYGIPKRWAFGAVTVEAATIFGALCSGSIPAALLIGVGGIGVLLLTWRYGPRAVVAASGSDAPANAKS